MTLRVMPVVTEIVTLTCFRDRAFVADAALASC
jgi:hypothetical protein